ncbi:MAG: hypothetical protein IT480_11860 [Gammaproteobacteria bacterium]|nr:hypothetical protein [Gammaproteobacteria bacterium]
MNARSTGVPAIVRVLLFCLGILLVPAAGQAAEGAAKPPLYTFAASWAMPRAQWGEMERLAAAAEKAAARLLADGTLTAFGSDTRLVHTRESNTHGLWWSARSIAGALALLDELQKSGLSTSPALDAATAHEDVLFVSRHYNWRSGTVKDGFTRGSFYQLKDDAPDDTLDVLASTFVVPMLDKLVADGTLQGYEIDTESVHTQKPGGFWLYYITGSATGLDRVDTAMNAALKDNPLAGPALGSSIGFASHRDSLFRTDAIIK